MAVDSYPPELTSGSLARSRDYNDSDRNSILTFTSAGTTLPRYSAVDLLDSNVLLEQVDHWNEADGSLVAVVGSDCDSSTAPAHNQPPEYTPSSPTTPRSPRSGGRRPHFVLHKFHLGGKGKKTDSDKGKHSIHPPWATLKLVSRPPALGSRVKTPRCIGGDPIRGSVDLALGTPMNVYSIKLTVSRPTSTTI